MPTYVIEREIPGADKLTAQELKEISAKSNEGVAGLGVPYKWITSYVAGDKIYCVHEAESADVVRRHASRRGFPVSKVTEVAAVIGPATGR
jgi:Nickel responsive protein SCO4226-like